MADTGVRFTHIFSSDQTRAVKTAEAIRDAQPLSEQSSAGVDQVGKLPITQLRELREQDFGSWEGRAWGAGTNQTSDTAPPRDGETRGSVHSRASAFLDQHLMPLWGMLGEDGDAEPKIVAVASHGMLLVALWREMLKRQEPGSVSLAVAVAGMQQALSLEYLASWSNTGYLELELCPSPGQAKGEAEDQAEAGLKGQQYVLRVCFVNKKEHLQGLKRTRGGVGSSTHDERQKGIETFFKKRKTG